MIVSAPEGKEERIVSAYKITTNGDFTHTELLENIQDPIFEAWRNIPNVVIESLEEDIIKNL